jgi:hypothetical protein
MRRALSTMLLLGCLACGAKPKSVLAGEPVPPPKPFQRCVDKHGFDLIEARFLRWSCV